MAKDSIKCLNHRSPPKSPALRMMLTVSVPIFIVTWDKTQGRRPEMAIDSYRSLKYRLISNSLQLLWLVLQWVSRMKLSKSLHDDVDLLCDLSMNIFKSNWIKSSQMKNSLVNIFMNSVSCKNEAHNKYANEWCSHIFIISLHDKLFSQRLAANLTETGYRLGQLQVFILSSPAHKLCSMRIWISVSEENI